MEKRNFYLKHYLPKAASWAILCGLFAFFFILARANFESSQAEQIFILTFPLYVSIAAIFGFFLHGGFRLVGINLEHRDAYTINTYVMDKHIDLNISDRNLKEIFNILKKEPIIAFKKAVIYSATVVFTSALTMYFIGTSISNIIIILAGGFIAVTILGFFVMFSTENFFASLLRKCRSLLKERKIEPKEEIQLFTLENRFYYFAFLFVLMVGIILSFVPNITLSFLAIFVTGFIMVVIVSKTLFSSVFLVFQEIKDFASKLAQEKKTEYFTGSSYKEVLSLSRDLTKNAEEIYQAREKERMTREEVEKRKEELEKFYKLTVGRELIMVELKEKIKKLEEKLKEEEKL